MDKHTPGPWKAYCRSVSYKGGEWPKDDFLQWEVEGPEVPSGHGEFFQADAYLVAAAPDLLAALQWLVYGEGEEVNCLEVIARATGAQH